MERAQAKLGFDPLDATAWSAHGVVVDAPVGLFGGVGGEGAQHGALLVAVSDAAKASAVLEPLLHTTCRAHGRWLACGDDVPLAASVDRSRWPEVEHDALIRSELFVAVKIPSQAQMADFAGGFFAEKQSVAAGLDLGEERIAMAIRYNNPQSGSLKPYLMRDPGGKSLLSAAHGAIGFARFNFSPAALWKLAQSKMPPKSIDEASNAMLAATGIDLKADLVDNLTGEIFGGLWEPSGFMSTLLIGTRDDARTADMARRLDGILAGVVSSVDGRAGVKTSHAVEKSHGRPVYVYKADFTGMAQPANIGLTQLEVHLCPAPGALLIAFDRSNRERALAALGGNPRDFLDNADPEVRRAFTSDTAMSAWGHGADFSAWYKSPGARQLLVQYASISPDLPGIITELASLSELIYDQTMALAVHDHDITLDWTMRLL
jgi:hypothetical protein